MHFLCGLLIGAALLGGPRGNADTIVVNDATPLIRAEYQALARKLAVRPAFVPTTGNRLEVLRSGQAYSEHLYSDFRSAQELIELELFLLGRDPDGRQACNILFKKIKEGVEVRYIHDNFGNFFDSIFDGRPVFTGFYDSLSIGGFKVRNISPLWEIDPAWANPNWRNHRKINIIDKKVAYTGGMNITVGSISGWGDTMLRITGSAVQSLRGILLLNWNDLAHSKADRDEQAIVVAGPALCSDGPIVQAVADGPDQPAFMMEETMVWVLDNAREYVWLETPYFLPSRPLFKAMKRASERGVDVRLFVPLVSDMTSFDPAYRSSLKDCLDIGVHVYYRNPPFNHSKTFLCDDYILNVGSSNYDRLSLESLYEVNVLVYDEAAALDHKAYLLDAMKDASEADYSTVASWDSKERFQQFLLGFISPFL